MGKETGTGRTLARILAIALLVFLNTAAAGSVVIQDGQIGTGNGTSPSRPIHITAIQDANLRLQDTSGSGPAAYIEFYNDTSRWGYVGLGGHEEKMTIGTTANKNLAFYTNSNEKMTLTAAGNVGIGTTSPEYIVDIKSAAAQNRIVHQFPDGTSNWFYNVFKDSTSGNYKWGQGVFADSYSDANLADSFSIFQYYDKNEAQVNQYRFLINNAGNVGIGTTSPYHNLQVGSGTFSSNLNGYFKIVSADALDARIGAAVGSGQTVFMKSVAAYGSLSAYNYNVAGPLPLVLNEFGGNVGIGTTAPLSKLNVDVENAANVNNGLTISRAGTYNQFGFRLKSDSGGIYRAAITVKRTSAETEYEAMTFDQSNGYVGIGTTSPYSKLDVAGEIGSNMANGGPSLWGTNTRSGSQTWYSASIGIGGTAYSASNRSGAPLWMNYDITNKRLGIFANDDVLSGYFSLGRGSYSTVSPTFTDMLVLASTGNIGIGTTSPGAKLQVDSDVQLSSAYPFVLERKESNAMDAYLWHNARWNSGYETASLTGKWLNTHSSFGSRGIAMSYMDGISFYADNVATTSGSAFTPTQRMIIKNNGNVGIGSTSPTAKLEVIGRGVFSPSSTDTDYGTVLFAGTPAVGGTWQSQSAAVLQIGPSSGNTGTVLKLNSRQIASSSYNFMQAISGVDGTPVTQFTIRGDGNVGIGNSTPMSKLQIGTYAASGNEYLQIDTENSIPASADCNSDAERGRMIVDGSNNRLYVCMGPSRGWDYLALTD